MRVPVYLSSRKVLRSARGGETCSTFFAPFDPDVEPYIVLATGDYADDRKTMSRDDALAGQLWALAYEVLLYQQWIESGEIEERGVDRRARQVVRRYAETTAHP